LCRRGAPPARVVDHERAGETGVGGREAGVEFDGAPQQRLGVAVGFSRTSLSQLASAQEAIVGFQIAGMLGGDALPVAGPEIERQRRDDVGRHVVLYRQDVGQVPVEPLGPQVPAGLFGRMAWASDYGLVVPRSHPHLNLNRIVQIIDEQVPRVLIVNWLRLIVARVPI